MLCICNNKKCKIPFGECHCGCGQSTRIAKQTMSDRGWIKGQPIQFLRGHAPRNRDHVLHQINASQRTANCDHCGEVRIKKDTTKQGWRCTRRHPDVRPLRHKLTNVNKNSLTGTCLVCGEVSLHQGSRGVLCLNQYTKHRKNSQERMTDEDRERRNAHNKEWRATPRGQEKLRRNWLLKRYGITPEDYDSLLAQQGGVCAICQGNKETRRKFFDIDHDHKTGKVRGLLCGPCNLVLGRFDDNPALFERAATYLRGLPT